MSAQVTDDTNQAADGRAQFRWRNCYGDVIASRYDLVVMDYWRKVVEPALRSAEEEVKHWARIDEGGACFVHANLVDQRAVTAAAMCLSLQSIWERQLRQYLLSCVGYAAAEAGLRAKIQCVPWDQLQALFCTARGVSMSAFLPYPHLDLLMLLGNVCRHGDGGSARKLWASHPELWPDSCRTPLPDLIALEAGVVKMVEPSAPSASQINITTSMLERFATSIADFWTMVEYLYNESVQIHNKDPFLEKKLVEDRGKLAEAIEYFNCATVATMRPNKSSI